MQHILVTGGLGFIGVSLLKHLSRDETVFIHNIDNLSLGVTHVDMPATPQAIWDVLRSKQEAAE